MAETKNVMSKIDALEWPDPLMIDVTIPADTASRVFDKTNPNWSPTTEYNQMFIRGVINYMNMLLRSRGHVLLNDVYDQLGITRTPAGCVVGWLYDFERPTEIVMQVTEYTLNGDVMYKLRFNIDGVIFDQL